MRVALVGPPYSGKSTLFAAVAEAGGSHVNLERADQEHLAVVKVPDERLEWMHELLQPPKKTHAEIEFLDVPGVDLSTFAAQQRARSHWLAVRQSDMIVFVLRAFRDDSVAAHRNRVDPAADLEELWAELLFSDLEQVGNRIEKLQAALRKPTLDRKDNLRELELMERMQAALEEEKPLSQAVKDRAEEKMLRAFAFLTLKPVMVVLNCDEDAAGESGPSEMAGYPTIQLSAKIEEEIASLAEAERDEFLEAMGVTELARDRLIRSCYGAMRLVSFFTAGPKEVRAWTIPAGTSAASAAGEIHSDMERGFIRAQVIAYDDLRAAGGEKEAKAAGKYRLEGKDYIVQDGDEILFRFNV